ncbi:potassium-transporting ATPase subunit C [Streptomyces eurocidicus]|uniref:Potassium-transporting ATPase KdpC subunit n=1 Tax=Streptomyces eurocidicus TaxID=66423 RepID=A0A2N8NW81_STREU|nr:K(+)-transporting ATPase subunit C [Streptomyces eurocidicus]MBB5122134.1 K+-transporting ATPase ATPase C chain [Streptomyces eurocidicus]MBF6055593.1 K(+)-transporting ATPase subunit C [Streptomyces eurocidicus]PNE33033.1 potassium-transporting ATPase subunit C [Streptomyces eurocidicus]
MNTSVSGTARLVAAGLRALLVLTVVCGVIYPLVVTGIAQVAFHGKANGSELKVNGKSVGSERLGQSYNLDAKDKDGNPLPDPKYFQPRPSAAGANTENTKYSLLVSGPSNLAADSKVLLANVEQRRADVAAFNGVRPSSVPVDALTASASGVDPDISPAYARLQADRVAKANHLPSAKVRELVDRHVDGRALGFMGEERVNVLKLNIALRELANG